MNIDYIEIKGLTFLTKKNDVIIEECYYGYDATNNLCLDVKCEYDEKFISKTKFENFTKRLIDLISSWDYEYNNPLSSEEFSYQIIIEKYNGYKVYFVGNDAYPENYRIVCNLIKKYTKFNMWCGNDSYIMYQDFLRIKPLYDLMEYFQNNSVDENFEQIKKLIENENLFNQSYDEEIKNNNLSFDNITNYDIDTGNEELIKAIFSYYFDKNYLKNNIINQNEHQKIINCLYRLLELTFFQSN